MRWYQRFFRREIAEQQLDSELQFHLDQQIAGHIQAGMDPDEARRRALAEFGGLEQVKEECRDVGTGRFIETLLQDTRYGLRQLRRDPGFAIVAVLILALGIGANVAIFSLVDQALLRSLPVQHPEQLVVLNSTELKSGSTSTDYSLDASFSYPMYRELRDKSRVFSGLLACDPYNDVNIVWQGHSERASAELVSGNFFQVLGVGAAIGRVLLPEDETVLGANPVAVLSYEYWEQHFGGDPTVLNQTIDINARLLTIVGVARRGFQGVQYGTSPELYIPLTMKPQVTPNWNGFDNVSDYFLAIMGRLEPSVPRSRVAAGLDPIFHSILESELAIKTAHKTITSREDQKHFLAGKIELTSGARGRPVLQTLGRMPLALLMAMVGLVLLIACANLAGLLLARGEARQHEIALRLAMGASRARLIRQLLTESLMVATAGGVASLLVGWWTLRLILSAMSSVPLAALLLSGLRANLDFRVLAFAASVTILSLLFFGLLPALKSSRADLHSSLKALATNTSGGVGSVRLRKLLVVSQVASSVILLTSSVLFVESLIRLERADLGMRIDHVIQFSIDPGLSHYSPDQAAALFDRLRQSIAAVPGVSSVSAAEHPLLAFSINVDTMKFENYNPGKGDDTTVSVNYVGPRFFSTIGIPLILGREFREGDSASSTQVAVINQKVARRFFLGRNPVGMHLAIGWGPDVHPNIEVVGIVADAKTIHPRDSGQPFVYFPYAQDSGVSGGTFYVRTQADPRTMATALRRVAARDAPNQPIYDLRTLAEQFNNSMSPDRLLTWFALSLALLAVLLAAVGLYGVMAYSTARRTREFAIRMALGAKRREVLRLVIGQGFKLASIGLGLGLVGAFALMRFLSSLLYGVKATDPGAFAGVSLILIAVALAASYLPGRRAIKVDPMVALRYE